MENKSLITELNCFRWKDDKSLERDFFGIQIEPTQDIEEAIKRAKSESDGDTFVCGYYTNGKDYGGGEYHSLRESKLKRDEILL